MDRSYRTGLAFHEAGHAVAAVALGMSFHSVTIRGSAVTEGAVYATAEDAERPDQPQRGPMPSPPRATPDDRLWLEPLAMRVLGGPVAQAGHERRFSYPHYASDLGFVGEFARRIDAGRGWDAWVLWLWCRTIDLLVENDNWSAVEEVAAALLARETLTCAEVREIHERATAPGLDLDMEGRASRARMFLTRRRPRLDLVPIPFAPTEQRP